MASARKRLLSYKSDKLKPKTEESTDKVPVPVSVPQISSVTTTTATSEKTDFKIPFIPTAEEIKEHPIFSGSSSLNLNFANSVSGYANGVGGITSCARLTNNETQGTSYLVSVPFFQTYLMLTFLLSFP